MTDLPPGWKHAPVDEIAGGIRTNVVIGPFGSSLKVSDYRDCGVPLIFVRNIRSNDFALSRARFITQEKAHELRAHEALPGDVLITKMGDPPGDATVYRGECPAVITADCIRLRPSEEFLPEYVALAFASGEIRRQIAHITRGVAQKKVSLSRFRHGVRIPTPLLGEQRQIVDILEDLLSRLEAAEGLVSVVGRRLNALRRSALSSVINTSDRRMVPLRDLVEGIEAGKSLGGAAPPASEDEWGIIKVSAMTWGEFKPEENKAISASSANPRYEIRPRDLLVSRANTGEYVGASVLVSAVRPRLLLSDKSLRVLPKDGVDRRWLWLALSSPEVRTQISAKATGTKDSMRNVSQAALLSVELPQITLSDQKADAARLSAYFESIGQLTKTLDAGQHKRKALRRALFTAAFSGRLARRASDTEILEEMAGV